MTTSDSSPSVPVEGRTEFDWRDGNGDSTPISRFMGGEVERVLAKAKVPPVNPRLAGTLSDDPPPSPSAPVESREQPRDLVREISALRPGAGSEHYINGYEMGRDDAAMVAADFDTTLTAVRELVDLADQLGMEAITTDALRHVLEHGRV